MLELSTDNMSIHLFLSSSDCLEYFPDNQQAKFQVKLETPMILDEYWYVALCEVRFKLKSEEKATSLSVNCNLCKPSLIHDNLRPVLRRISRKPSQEFLVRQYFAVNQKYVERIGIDIYTNFGTVPAFNNQPLEVTLHLKRAVHHHFL